VRCAADFVLNRLCGGFFYCCPTAVTLSDRRDAWPEKRPMKAPICLWSGPRNVSTALMYSFAQRRDIRVVGDGARGPVTERLQKLYQDYAYARGEPLPF
jgi:hypothetical protein